jgi:hypothetical protein
MSGSLFCCSFHSVKGGVGKSTLATICAVAQAQIRSEPVYLIDMDLTGTSLADVLPLCAPILDQEESTEALDLRQPPKGFLSLEQTRQGMEDRFDAFQEVPNASGRARFVPFLNDYLLYATKDWDEEDDASPEALGWKLEGASENLRVIPSSAIPGDLERILPIVFDEYHAAFLEARLEYLLDALVPEEGDAFVVFDTPPSIPGLSRAVLSLALRLGQRSGTKVELSQDGGMPEALSEAFVKWTAFMVTTLDHQDIRAAGRWLNLVQPEEEHAFELVLNQAPNVDDRVQRETMIALALKSRAGRGGESGLLDQVREPFRFFDDPIWVPRQDGLVVFDGKPLPENIGELAHPLMERLR